MGDIYAALVRDSTGSSGVGGRTPIAGYALEIGDRSIGRVDFYVAETVEEPAGTGVEIIELEESCVAKLLADAAGALASQPDVGEIDEPAFEQPAGKYRSAGIVLVDERGWLTIREPANHFGGYKHSYAKGRIDTGETPQQAAGRELAEETGLIGRIVGLVGDFPGDTSVTRFYVGVRTGGEEEPSAETWAIKTVSPRDALKMLNCT